MNECPSLAELQPATEGKASPGCTEKWYPTSSQSRGLKSLHQLADVFARTGGTKFAGFRPACHRALIIGASGSGKTNLVNQFASERNVPSTAIDCGSFIVSGAAVKPTTLQVVRDFVRSCKRSRDDASALEGIVFFDEICKLIPSESQHQSGWSLSVAAEAIALLSSDSRLAAHDWSSSDIRRLRDNIMIIGGGAFQSALIEVRAASHRGDLGFANSNEARSTHLSEIAKYLPEEILSRFSSTIIVLEAPTRQDYEQSIVRIHSQLGIRRQASLSELVDEAVKGLGGMRWVENYLCQLLYTHPYAIRGRKSEAPVPEREPISRAYDVALDFSACKKEANEIALKLRTTLGLVYSRLQCIADAGQSLPQGGMLNNPQFYTILTDAITACGPTNRVSDDETRDPVGMWRAVAWQVLGESSPFLAAHGLSEMWAEAWSIAGALIDHRRQLFQAIQREQLG